MQGQPHLKRSLCRYYLRGLCLLSRKECEFAHGIQDLAYHPLGIDEEVEYDYLKETNFTQRTAAKGPRIYINLYEFQTDKKYSLEQLGNDKLLRNEIRSKMHQSLFHQFMTLLEKVYPEANFTEAFLLQEYTRVGFNKLMTRIKFSHLTNFLCSGENPRYFMKSIVMPPLVKQNQSFLFPRPSQKDILNFYRNECQRILDESEEKVDQAFLKKQLFQKSFGEVHFPTLSQILQEKKASFSQFLKMMNSSQQLRINECIQLDANPEDIAAMTFKYLESRREKLTTWSDVYMHLSKQSKINNGTILNQAKHFLAANMHYLLYFPMIQYITSPQHLYPFQEEAHQTCKCSFKQIFDLSWLEKEPEYHEGPKESESVDIYDYSSLIRCAKSILKSRVLGVDLEGRLRKGGYVETVQLSNGQNTFIIDFHLLTIRKDTETIQLAKKILRNVFVNQNVLKIFHDCRHDSLVLHECLNTCILNIFDTSAVETLKVQLQVYSAVVRTEKEKVKLAKKAVTQCSNIRTLGLNQIYRRYQASHGINKNKEKFHKMFESGKGDFFLQRPMDVEYRDYCIRDVLDLPEVYDKMTSEMPRWAVEQGKWVSSHYVAYGYERSACSGKSSSQI